MYKKIINITKSFCIFALTYEMIVETNLDITLIMPIFAH